MSSPFENNDASNKQSNEEILKSKKDAFKSLVTCCAFNMLPFSGLIAPAAYQMAWSYDDSGLKEHLNELLCDRFIRPPAAGPPAGNDPPIDPNIFNLSYVGGLDEVVQFLYWNIILPWLTGNPRNNCRDGCNLIDPAKGVIFYGPPGTGKTLMGKCLAGELIKLSGRNISFIMRRGTDTFSKYVGESEANLQNVFAEAQRNKPSIIFFDEIDGLLPERQEGTQDHRTSVVTTFLGLIDKVNRGEVFVIGATNRLDALDPAALRPGRFDKHIRFTPPNQEGRIHILNENLKKWEEKDRPSNQEITQIAAQTIGYTGADIEQLLRNSANCAIERQVPRLRVGKGFGPEHIQNALGALRNVRVTMVDWMIAIEGMSRTNANVFGSTIYCGVPLARNLVPLLGEIVKQLKAECDGFLDLCPCLDSTTGIKILLCYGTTDSEIQTLDCIIVPAVIGSFDSMKIKGFIAAAENGKDIFGALTKAKSGALEKPSVLFIPRIDIIWTNLGAIGLQNTFLKEMEDARNSNLLIITTALSPLQGFPPQLQEVFQGVQRSMQPRKPTESELRNFLSPIFNVDSQTHQSLIQAGKTLSSKFDKRQLNGLLARAVRGSLREEIRSILTFYYELLRVLSQGYNGAGTAANICQNLDATITTFIRTKFMN